MTALVSAVNRWLSKRAARDAGFTLVEVIISVSLLGLITGAATASMLTATSAARSTSQNSHESTDAQLISAFLVRDAQAAGGSKPSTGTVDPALGVSKTDDAGCLSSDTLKLRFKWYDRFSPPTDLPTPVYFSNVITYGLNGSHQLVRHSCVDGAPKGDVILGTNVQSVTAGCIPVADCSVLPDIVTLLVTETNSPAYSATPFTFNLQAQVRSESQVAPSTASAGAVPLMALGGGPCPSSGAYLSISGNSDLTIELGGAIINAADSTTPPCSAMKMSGSPLYAADSTSILSGGTCSAAGGITCPSVSSFPTKLVDPLADLVAPVPSPPCSPAGPNPALVSGHYVAGTYRQPVTLNSSDVFDDGVYIFCQGLKITGKLVAPHVMLFFAGGTLEMAGNSDVSIGTIPLPSPYSNVAIWVPKTNPATALEIRGGTGINSYKGIIYAPNAILTVSGSADISIGSVIARAINLIGTGHETFGPGITITTPFLPSAPQGLSYNFAMSVAGGIPPYSIWSANGLAATGGLSMTTGGVISGTPTILGTHVIEFFISDSSTPSRTTSRKLDLTVSNSALTISPLTLKSATLNNNYFQRITASGGSGVYTSWALQVGDSLPAGLSFGAPGIDYIDILGTPTGGTRSFTLIVTDTLGFTAQRLFTLTVNPEPAITAASLALVKNTTETATYSAALATTGGTGPFTWAVSGGSLPSGVTLNPTTGLLFGAVGLSTANSYVFSVTATDVNLAVAEALNIPLTVYAKPDITTGLSLPPWDVGTTYNQTLTSAGGSPPLSWSVASVSPAATVSVGGGLLVATFPTNATYTISVKLTDGSGVSVTKSFRVAVAAALAITTPTSLPNGELGLPYTTVTATRSGGTPGFAWSATNLPPGVTINPTTGLISGTPTAFGEYTPTITVLDATGNFVSLPMNKVTIFRALSVTFANTFPDWDAGATYPNYPLPAAPSVSYGSGVYSFGVTPLPAGLSLNASNGGIGGTPSTAATYNTITWTVSDSLGQSISRTYGPVNIYSPLTITGTNTMPNWDANFAYPNQTFIGGGGSPGAKVWSASGLPNGMTISPTGVVGGTPTVTGPFSATITYADPTVGASVSVVRPFTISTPPAITTPAGSLPPWTVGRPGYSATFAVAGGATPLTWSIAPVASGGQPFAAATGLTFNLSTGTISGTPTGAVSNVAYRVTVTDAVGITNSQDYTLTLNPAITVSGLSGSVTRGVPYSSIVSATGGTGTLTWSSSSPLPAGLTWNAATRTVSGTPNSSGSWVMTVTATDSVGATGSQTQNVLIQPTVTSVAFVNGGNAAGAGKMEKGDSIVITFSDDILSSTLCSASWTGTSTNVLVKLNDGGTTANDTITLTADGGCVPSIGTIDLGGKAFATTGGPVVFGGANGSGGRSTIALATTTTPAPIKSTLTITLGTASPANGNGMGSFTGVTANAIYNPNNPTTVISDPRGAFIAGTATIAPTANKFF